MSPLRQAHRQARLDVALLEHPEIPPAPPVPVHLLDNVPDLVPPGQRGAGLTWMGHLEARLPDLEHVADTRLVLGDALDGEILPERSGPEVVPAPFLPPE